MKLPLTVTRKNQMHLIHIFCNVIINAPSIFFTLRLIAQTKVSADTEIILKTEDEY